MITAILMVAAFIAGAVVGDWGILYLSRRRHPTPASVRLTRQQRLAVAWLYRPLEGTENLTEEQAQKIARNMDLPVPNGVVVNYLTGEHDMERMEYLMDQRLGLGEFNPDPYGVSR